MKDGPSTKCNIIELQGYRLKYFIVALDFISHLNINSLLGCAAPPNIFFELYHQLKMNRKRIYNLIIIMQTY